MKHNREQTDRTKQDYRGTPFGGWSLLLGALGAMIPFGLFMSSVILKVPYSLSTVFSTSSSALLGFARETCDAQYHASVTGVIQGTVWFGIGTLIGIAFAAVMFCLARFVADPIIGRIDNHFGADSRKANILRREITILLIAIYGVTCITMAVNAYIVEENSVWLYDESETHYRVDKNEFREFMAENEQLVYDQEKEALEKAKESADTTEGQNRTPVIYDYLQPQWIILYFIIVLIAWYIIDREDLVIPMVIMTGFLAIPTYNLVVEIAGPMSSYSVGLGEMEPLPVLAEDVAYFTLSVLPGAVLSIIIGGIFGIVRTIKYKRQSRAYRKRIEEKRRQETNRAEEERKERIEKYREEIRTFSENQRTDVVFLMGRRWLTGYDSRGDQKIQRNLEEKKEAYGPVLAGGSIRTVEIGEAVTDRICETIEGELKRRGEPGAGEHAEKTLFEVYVRGSYPDGEVYTRMHLVKLMKKAGEENCKFNFALDRPYERDLFSQNHWSISGDRDLFSTDGYFKWKQEFPDHLIVMVEEAESRMAFAHEKGAVVLDALMEGIIDRSLSGQYCVNGRRKLISPGAVEGFYGGPRDLVIDSIAKLKEYRSMIISTLEKYRINYILATSDEIIDRRDFGDNYKDFPASLYPAYQFSEEDFREAYVLEGNRPDRYYDGTAWRDADDVAMKRRSYWRAEYPDAVVVEVKSNSVCARAKAIDKDAEHALNALTERGWVLEGRHTVFRAAEILEDAQVDYAIIHSGKVEFFNRFKNGRENYQKYVKLGREGKHVPSIALKLEKSLSHGDALRQYDDHVRELDGKLRSAKGQEADHPIAHAMSECRNSIAPDLAIRLFHRYEEYAGSHMLVSVAAAYNDIRDYEKAMHYIELAPDGEYKENTREKIIRDAASHKANPRCRPFTDDKK